MSSDSIKLITTASNETAAPVSKTKLDGIIREQITKVDTLSNENDANRTIIKSILEALKKTSSLHKFIVNLNTLTYSPNDYNNANTDDESSQQQLQIKNTFGSVWDGKKDGSFNYKVEHSGKVYLISIIWIFADN